MNNLKGDIINDAFARLVISGITTQPTPEDLTVALDRLENLDATLKGSNICTGYNTEDNPDPNAPHGLDRKYIDPYTAILAFNLCSYYGKTPSPVVVNEQQVAYSFLSSSTATPRETLYPSRQPAGSGNSRYSRYRRFYPETSQAPNDCATVKMTVGDINDYTEHFDSYLRYDGETISSYTIESESGLTVIADSLNSPDVLYTIRADGSSENNNSGWYQLKIVATTSIGRIETRIVNFELTKEVIEQ